MKGNTKRKNQISFATWQKRKEQHRLIPERSELILEAGFAFNTVKGLFDFAIWECENYEKNVTYQRQKLEDLHRSRDFIRELITAYIEAVEEDYEE